VNLVKGLVQFTEECQQKAEEQSKQANDRDGEDNDITEAEDPKETTMFEKADEY
jgi:hypothetical protein